MSINAKEFTLSRVNPDRVSTDPVSNTVADDWQFLCGGEAFDRDINNNFNSRRKLKDCQDRTSKVVDEKNFTGRTVSLSISGTIENTAAGRWLLELARSDNPVLEDARVYLPGIEYMRGDFAIGNFKDTASDLDGNVTFSATLDSSGDTVFTTIALA